MAVISSTPSEINNEKQAKEILMRETKNPERSEIHTNICKMYTIQK